MPTCSSPFWSLSSELEWLKRLQRENPKVFETYRRTLARRTIWDRAWSKKRNDEMLKRLRTAVEKMEREQFAA